MRAGSLATYLIEGRQDLPTACTQALGGIALRNHSSFRTITRTGFYFNVLMRRVADRTHHLHCCTSAVLQPHFMGVIMARSVSSTQPLSCTPLILMHAHLPVLPPVLGYRGFRNICGQLKNLYLIAIVFKPLKDIQAHSFSAIWKATNGQRYWG